MYCRECGAQIPDDSRFCPACGTEQATPRRRGGDIFRRVVVRGIAAVGENAQVVIRDLVHLNITIDTFKLLIDSFKRHWPALLVIFVFELMVLIVYFYLAQIVWIRQWVLVVGLILVPVIVATLYVVIRLPASRRRRRSSVALAIVAFLVLLGVIGWQVYWIFGSPWRAIAVAQFDDSQATQKANVQDDICTTMQHAGIPDEQIVRLGLITDPKEAIILGRKFRTKIVMWGWYNDVEISPHFEVIKLLHSEIDLSETYVGTSEEELARFRLYLARELPSELTALGLMTLGIIHYYDERYDEALQSLKEAERWLPQSGRTVNLQPFYLFRGNTFRRLHRYSDAIEEFDRAIAVDPDSGDDTGVFLYNQRGLAYYRLGEYEKAIADFSKALEWEPEQVAVLYNRGKTYYDCGRFDDALADFDHVLRVQPLQEGAHYIYVMRGSTYTHLGRYEDAVIDADRAIQADPGLSSAYFVRAVAYFKLGKLEMALKDTDKAIELDPQYIGAYYYRGKTHEQLGDSSAALADYQTVRDICLTVDRAVKEYATKQCETYEEEALKGVQRLEEQ